MRTPYAIPHMWDDPAVPLTIENPAGRRALVDVATPTGERPFGFTVEHDPSGERLTVRWPGIVCAGDDLTQHEVPPPPGPLVVAVIATS